MVTAFRLEGSSMLPVFKTGEIAIVECKADKAKGKIRPGDCAVYSHEGRILLHRVVKTGPEGAWLADDAGRLEPHLVSWRNIRGKVLSQNPLAGGFLGRVYSKLRRFTYSRFTRENSRKETQKAQKQ